MQNDSLPLYVSFNQNPSHYVMVCDWAQHWGLADLQALTLVLWGSCYRPTNFDHFSKKWRDFCPIYMHSIYLICLKCIVHILFDLHILFCSSYTSMLSLGQKLPHTNSHAIGPLLRWLVWGCEAGWQIWFAYTFTYAAPEYPYVMLSHSCKNCIPCLEHVGNL